MLKSTISSLIPDFMFSFLKNDLFLIISLSRFVINTSGLSRRYVQVGLMPGAPQKEQEGRGAARLLGFLLLVLISLHPTMKEGGVCNISLTLL